VYWAMTKNNLGMVLRDLGERESGTARLEEAEEAHRDALKIYTREDMPLDWARAQANLGTALQALGKREAGTARLEKAAEAIEMAWQVCRDAALNQHDPWFEGRLKSINDLIASRRSGYGMTIDG
jgi:tetratricopeptide (TPR) repeat protein